MYQNKQVHIKLMSGTTVSAVVTENQPTSTDQSETSSKQHCGIKWCTVVLAIGPVISYKMCLSLSLCSSRELWEEVCFYLS